jgi:hypothetical protein
LTIGAGFLLGVPAEISILGFSAPGIAIGVASVLFESSGRGVGSRRTDGTASWARANSGRASARPMHRTIWRIPLWTRVDDALRSLPVTSNNRSPLPSAVALTTVIFPFASRRLFRRFSLLVRLEATGKKQCAKRICRYIPSRFSFASGVLAQLVERLNGIGNRVNYLESSQSILKVLTFRQQIQGR